MPDKEYEKEKEALEKNDKKRSMIMFPLLFLVIFSGLVYIVLNR